MKDYLVDDIYGEPYLAKSLLTRDDAQPKTVMPTIIRFMRSDGVIVKHVVNAAYGIGWCIRHARGIGDYDNRCVWWDVTLGTGVRVAESKIKRCTTCFGRGIIPAGLTLPEHECGKCEGRGVMGFSQIA